MGIGDWIKSGADLVKTGKEVIDERAVKKQQSEYSFDVKAGVYRKPDDEFAYCPKCFHDKRFVPMQETRYEYTCPYCGADKPIPGAPSRYEGYTPIGNIRDELDKYY